MSWGLFIAGLFVALIGTRCAVWLLFLATKKNQQARMRILLFLFIHLVSSISIGQISINNVVWSLVGDLSIASFLLISASIVKNIFIDSRLMKQSYLVPLLVGIIIVAIPLYCLTLVGYLQMYNDGFNGFITVVAISLVGIAFSFTSYIVLSLWTSLALLAWLVGLGESANVYDYLVDPIAMLWSIYLLARQYRVLVKNKLYS